mgnify:CR=1 FL=1
MFKDGTRDVENRRIEMYHGSTDDDSKQRILNNFKPNDAILKVLVCTVAFGMGVSIPDIDAVIHWGAPKNILCYWQEVGRAGRSNQHAIALMYPYKRSIMKTITSEDVRHILVNKTCVRQSVLKVLKTKGMQDLQSRRDCIEKECQICECGFCACCIECFMKCQCTGKLHPKERFLM